MPPLRGLSKRQSAFPQIGIIRKGAPKGERAIGRDLEYFRLDFDEAEKEAADEVLHYYSAEPKELVVMLPFNDIGRCWERYNEAHLAGAMIHRCDCDDGLILRDIDHTTGKPRVVGGLSVETGQPVYCKGEVLGQWKNNNTGRMEDILCKPAGRLKVLLQPIRRLAYMVLLTGSVHDIVNLEAQLNAIWEFNQGHIVGIPLVLRRRKKSISTPGEGGKKVRRVKSLLSIEADPAWVEYRLSQASQEVLPGQKFALLPAAEEKELETGGAVVEVEEDESHFEEITAAVVEPETTPAPARTFSIKNRAAWSEFIEWAAAAAGYSKNADTPYRIQEALKAAGVSVFSADNVEQCKSIILRRVE